MPESVYLWSTTAASNGNSDPGINYQEGQLPGTLNNSDRAVMAALAKLRDDQGGKLTTAGTQPTYTLTTASGVPALADGVRLHFVCHSTNAGGASTLNVDALGAKALRKGADVALAAGDLVANAHYLVQYDASANGAAGAWLLLNQIVITDFLGLSDTPDSYTSQGNKLVGVNSGATALEFVTKSTVGTGKQSIWIPATAMTARTTNGAASGTVQTTTNLVMLKSLDFDTTTQEFAQFNFLAPKGWNEGTVTFKAVWSHAATTVNFGVAWSLAGQAFSDDDAADTAFGTAIVVTDTGGTTNDVYITAESAAVTIGGTPAEGDWLVFQVARVPADGGDTMAIDARLHGIMLLYTTSANTDD